MFGGIKSRNFFKPFFISVIKVKYAFSVADVFDNKKRSVFVKQFTAKNAEVFRTVLK